MEERMRSRICRIHLFSKTISESQRCQRKANIRNEEWMKKNEQRREERREKASLFFFSPLSLSLLENAEPRELVGVGETSSPRLINS